MRIYIFPEKKGSGVGRINSPETEVAMFAVGSHKDFGELFTALEICRDIGYNQTKYIHKLDRSVYFLDAADLQNDDENPMFIMYVDKTHMLSLLGEEVDDPIAALLDDLDQIPKIRREIVSVVGLEDLSEDLTRPTTRLDFLTILPSCLRAVLNNRIPQRRNFIAVHESLEDEELVEIVNSLSHIFHELIELYGTIVHKVE